MATTTTMLSFDLEDAESEDYEAAHEVLKKFGFKRTLPGKLGKVFLPESSAVSAVATGVGTAESICQAVWEALAAKKLPIKRLAVATGNDAWAKAKS